MNTEIKLSNAVLKPILISSAFTILVTAILYIVDPVQLGSFMIQILIGILNLVLIGYFTAQYRKDLGGYAPFKSTFLFSFIVLLCAGLVDTVFRLILFNVIDPELSGIVVQSTLETMESGFKRMGMDDDAIDKAMENVDLEDLKNAYSPVKLLTSYPISAIFYAIGAAIIGAITKKNDPQAF